MMPMFQQGSRMSALIGFSPEHLMRPSSHFTYNSSPYVHALNRALQLEQAAISLYCSTLRSAHTDDNERQAALAQQRHSCHHHAYRELVRLIFAQRGLPDAEPVSLSAITATVAAQISHWMPPALNRPMLGASTQRLESVLLRRYDELLRLAPQCDEIAIQDLREQTRDFLSEPL